jgi:hypothetical protein
MRIVLFPSRLKDAKFLDAMEYGKYPGEFADCL